jgi:hypothetical protein
MSGGDESDCSARGGGGRIDVRHLQMAIAGDDSLRHLLEMVRNHGGAGAAEEASESELSSAASMGSAEASASIDRDHGAVDEDEDEDDGEEDEEDGDDDDEDDEDEDEDVDGDDDDEQDECDAEHTLDNSAAAKRNTLQRAAIDAPEHAHSSHTGKRAAAHHHQLPPTGKRPKIIVTNAATVGSSSSPQRPSPLSARALAWLESELDATIPGLSSPAQCSALSVFFGMVDCFSNSFSYAFMSILLVQLLSMSARNRWLHRRR